MSDTSTLGRLKRINLREEWEDEAQHFTPWLAKPENMELLGETLGLELEVEAQERNVGPFRADILCKDLVDNSWVLVENQLERTDHTHLGQLLTYGAGLNAVTIIWIAEKFADEHRAALDWLNDITDEHFRFFGLELELWRIGDSATAPKFNIVSKPNEWSREVVKTKKQAGLTKTQKSQLVFWEHLYQKLQGHPFLRPQKPYPSSWTAYSIGRSGTNLAAVMDTRRGFVAVELYLLDNATAFFNLLKNDKIDIENEVGAKLIWHEMPGKKSCRIRTNLENVDPLDEKQWPHLHTWLQDHIERYYKAFQPRVKKLNPDDYQPEEDG